MSHCDTSVHVTDVRCNVTLPVTNLLCNAFVHILLQTQIAVEKMAASIQALALSCHDTGMFGELPKPRVNSIPWRQ